MLNKLRPNKTFAHIVDITPDWLKQQNLRAVIFDLDNTAIPWGEWQFNHDFILWINRLKTADIRLCILSNGAPHRVKHLSQVLNLPAVSGQYKPGKRAFKEALRILGTARENTTVIGDQIFTDVLGGNRLGLYTILVPPLSHSEFIGTKLVRRIERLVLKGLARKGQY